MARPRKTLPATDLFVDLSKKTEILEREMTAQRAALERLKQLGRQQTAPAHAPADEEDLPRPRRAAR